MMHRTIVEADTPEMLTRRATEAVVHLYRRSQVAGDEGRLFIVRRMGLPGHSMEIGLLRTNDANQIASVMKWRDLFNEDVHEFSEDAIRALFEAA